MPAKKKKTTKKKVKKTKLKKKAIYCPHCKKKVKIEDLEVIEDTRGAGGVKDAISFVVAR